ncbi:MAG: 50S ribosomal protein L10, partial [Pseudomonadota bacterium]
FSKNEVGILTDYRGLTTADLNGLRRRLREANVEYKVVKNTLAQFAAERAGMAELIDLFRGPVAVALGRGDAAVSARALVEYVRSSKLALGIKGGFLGKRLLTARDVETLATLPAREVLISQVMAGVQSPIVALVSVLAAPIRGMMGVLQARMKQLEGE